MTDVSDLLEDASAGLATRDAVSAPAQRARADISSMRFYPCGLCNGHGADLSPIGILCGTNCWGCAGWGRVWAGYSQLRGPFGAHPSRCTPRR